MTDWIPDTAVITPDRQVILDLIELLKREMIYHDSVVLTLQELAHSGRPESAQLAIEMAEKIKEQQEATSHLHVTALFRPSVSALMRGEEYLQHLQAVISKKL